MNPINKFTSSGLYNLLGSTRKARIVSASALFLAVCAFGAAGVIADACNATGVIEVDAVELKFVELGGEVGLHQEADVERFARGADVSVGIKVAASREGAIGGDV